MVLWSCHILIKSDGERNGSKTHPATGPIIIGHRCHTRTHMGRIKIISTLTFVFSPIISSKSSFQKGGDSLHE